MAAHITAWDKAGRPSPQLTVRPAGTADADLPPGHVLDKRHTRLVISWHTT
jgi:protein-L-isoaspartate(D-aspartate) O-methyltransferase